MAKEYYYFEADDIMTFQGNVYTSIQEPGYVNRNGWWIITPDDAKLEGL